LKISRSFYLISDNRNAAQHIKSIFENCVVPSDKNFYRIKNDVIIIDHDKLNKSSLESFLKKHNDIFIIREKEQTSDLLDLVSDHLFFYGVISDNKRSSSFTAALRQFRQYLVIKQQFEERIKKLENKVFDIALASTDVLALKEEMEMLATKDSLTQLFNYTFFNEKLHEEFERAKRYNLTFSLVIFDLDYFKHVNDTYGHLMGDKVLKTFSEILSTNIRPMDIPCRYGGDEFVIICVETDAESCSKLVDRIRKIFNATEFRHENKTFKCIFSSGITEYNDQLNDISDMIKLADEALYESKNKGRNRTTINK